MENIKNPRIIKDDNMVSGQKVTWDCVWFGGYPQSEVKSEDPVYEKLKNAREWNNNNIIIDDIEYRRIKVKNIPYYSIYRTCYPWAMNTITYRYFKYDLIKWRVLSVENDKAFILSDVVLDNQKYNNSWDFITWEKSTIRSWLNGYGGESNTDGIDYSNRNFIDSAFNSNEKKEILCTTIRNLDNSYYSTESVVETNDRIFLLSESEVHGEQGAIYGFNKYYCREDETRMCKNSDYAETNSEFPSGYGSEFWYLRSPGINLKDTVFVGYIASVFGERIYGNSGRVSVRPALYLNLSNSNQYAYAGTVCSDGTVIE